MGLYRDDGIIFIPESNAPKTSNILKKIIKAFKLLGLRIQIASNFKIVDFLDVTLNLNNDTSKPSSKNDSAPKYVNIASNHPRSWTRGLISYPHVKEFLLRAKVYMMMPQEQRIPRQTGVYNPGGPRL